MPPQEASGLGQLEIVDYEQGSLCDWSGVHIWLSLGCPKLKAGTKYREAVSY